MKLEKAIQQSKFKNEYQKVSINILYTASWLQSITAQVIKPFGISWQQFNILRILRGQHPEPASVKLLTERMIDKMSNASRLVDKLYAKKLVDRKNCPHDRRQVRIQLTEAGANLVNEASEVLEGELNKQLKSLSKAQAKQLNELLDLMRG